MATGEAPARQNMLRFGEFELDLDRQTLSRRGIRLKLQNQPCQVLILLIQRAPEVVARDEIRQRVWGNDVYIDTERSINFCIRQIRGVLLDNAASPRFIETLPREGYRFIAPLSQRNDDLAEPAGQKKQTEEPQSAPPVKDAATWQSRNTGFDFRLPILAVAVLVLIGVGLSLWFANSRNSGAGASAPPVPLTSYPGFQQFPSFSPDGSRVAFTWDEPHKRLADIYVKLVGPGDPVRLTTGTGENFASAWSPDGRLIAYLQKRDSSHVGVMVIPALGGVERELASITFGSIWYLGHGSLRWPVPAPLLVWSADSKWMLAVEQDTESGPYHIMRISVETGEKRRLTFPPAGTFAGDGSLTLSPDGKTLAFTRTVAGFVSDIFRAPVNDNALITSDPERLTFDRREVAGLAWNADGRSLVFASSRGSKLDLWRMPPSPFSRPVKLTAAGDDPADIAISRQGRRLVYRHALDDVNIWRHFLKGRHAGKSEVFISSTRFDGHAKCSPDGKRIAFESNRSGNEEIWTCNADGSNPVQLTSFHNSWAGSPRWSPDGRKIAFDGSAAGNWDIYVIDSSGGKPTRLTSDSASHVRPSWSHDGKWIYYSCNRTGTFQIWKIPTGGGQETQVTQNGGFLAYESLDGKSLYFSPGQGLWSMPVERGREAQILESVDTRFAPAKGGIYFIDPGDENLKFFDFRTRALKTIAPISGPTGRELSVSPDEQWIFFDKQDRAGSELMLVENFQ